MEGTEIITLEDYLTSSGKYPERAKHPECTDELKDKALNLITRVNAFLIDVGIRDAKVSSGFRPSSVNKGIKNASRKSNHMDGDALDLADPDGEIDKVCLKNLKLLEKHGLYLEEPAHTKGWCHLQDEAPRSGKRVFRP